MVLQISEDALLDVLAVRCDSLVCALGEVLWGEGPADGSRNECTVL